MNRNNVLILAAVVLMVIFGIVSFSLFSKVEAGEKRNKALADSLKVQLDSNLLIRKEKDSFANLLLKFVDTTTKVKDSAVTTVIKGYKSATEVSIQLNDINIYNKALALEKAGFDALANNQFEKALGIFRNIEKISPSFHMVYEIQRYLGQNKDKFNDPAKFEELKKWVIKNCSWRAPADQLTKLKSQVRS